MILNELPYKPKQFLEKSWVKFQKSDKSMKTVQLSIECDFFDFINVEFVISEHLTFKMIIEYVKQYCNY